MEREISQFKLQWNTDWDILYREHRWLDPISSTERFIDLVLRSHAVRMVIECKRVQDATWLFLISDDKVDLGRARLFWTYTVDQQKSFSGWDQFKFTYSSPELPFCIVRGKEEGDNPMLEHLAGIVLRSTEVLADEELGMGRKRVSGRPGSISQLS